MNPRNWSLRARLIAVMVALLAVTSIIIGGVMFLAVQNALWGQFDVSVQNAAQRIGHPREGDDGPTGSGSQLDPGTIVAGYGFDGTTAGYYKTSGTAQSPLLRTQLSSVRPVASRYGIIGGNAARARLSICRASRIFS